MAGIDRNGAEFLKALDAIRAHSTIYQGIGRVRSRYAGSYKGEALFYAALSTYLEEEMAEGQEWANKREDRIEELEDKLSQALKQLEIIKNGH